MKVKTKTKSYLPNHQLTNRPRFTTKKQTTSSTGLALTLFHNAFQIIVNFRWWILYDHYIEKTIGSRVQYIDKKN